MRLKIGERKKLSFLCSKLILERLLLRKLQNENREAEQILNDLQEIPIEDERFEYLAEALRSQMLSQTERQETDLFDNVLQVTPDDQLQLIGDQIEKRRAELFGSE